jgi:hypothetical protein
MTKITLEIEDKNLSTVLNILDNLKTGLILDRTINKNEKIKPVSSSISNNENKRYLSKEAYKKRLNQKIEEDEFLPKVTNPNKYLSSEEYKKRLKG